MKTAPVFRNRPVGTLGLDMYFYNLSTLMIYEYEIKYQLSQGDLNSRAYPSGHSELWMEADLYLTQGKSNARTESEFGCNILKNNYNLKKILENPRSYGRVLSIGKLCKAFENDINTVQMLLNEEFHEYGTKLSECYYSEDHPFDVFMQSLSSDLPYTRGLMQMMTEDIAEKFVTTEYPENDMRDDMGMIQNTMRNVIYSKYE